MKKIVWWKSDAAIYTYIAIIILAISIFAHIDSTPTEIDYTYSGIKYQSGNPDNFEIVEIEIQGEYWNRLFEKESYFEGTIKIGDLLFNTDKPWTLFTPDGRWMLVKDEFHGMLHQRKGFEILTIRIFEKKPSDTGFFFNYDSGWLISSPCKTREEAVEISNKLFLRGSVK